MKLSLFLDGYLSVSSRARYNCWDLLGDIGGFYDGLIIVGMILFGAYSAFAFQNDLLSGVPYDDDDAHVGFRGHHSQRGSRRGRRESDSSKKVDRLVNEVGRADPNYMLP